MMKAALVGALALAAIGVAPVAAAEDVSSVSQISRTTFVITDAHISRLHSMLRLTAAQERHWPAVEAALRRFAREQAREDAAASGFVQRLRTQASSVASQAVSLKRVVSAAMPLIRSLDEDQKRDATRLARALGFDKLASAL
jgi:hypothetical protein